MNINKQEIEVLRKLMCNAFNIQDEDDRQAIYINITQLLLIPKGKVSTLIPSITSAQMLAAVCLAARHFIAQELYNSGLIDSTRCQDICLELHHRMTNPQNYY